MVLKDITQTSLEVQQYVNILSLEQGQTYNNYWSDDHPIRTNKKPRGSRSMLRRNITLLSPDTEKRRQFLQDMECARNQLATFRQEMEGLATQINSITDDLHESKNRVHEIEQDLTETQEDNVNLQVLLERAVKSQKESDVFANQTIRSIHSDLHLVVLENNSLQERLSSIEYMQREHKGNAHDTVTRMREYIYMLEQAQDTIQLMQETTTKYPLSLLNAISMHPDSGLDSRRTSETSSSCISKVTGISVRIEPTKQQQQQQQQQQHHHHHHHHYHHHHPRSSSITSHPRIIHNRVSLSSSPISTPRKDISLQQRQQHLYFEHKHQRRQISHHNQQQHQQRKRRQNPLPQGLLLLLND